MGQRSGVSVHSELGQVGTKWDKEEGFLCTVSWDKLGQRSRVSVHSELGQVGTRSDKEVGFLSTVSWDKLGQGRTKKWGFCAQ